MEDCADKLDGDGLNYLSRVRVATQRMAELIDDMLQLSRVTRADFSRRRIDISVLAREVVAELQRQEPERQVDLKIQDGIFAEADSRLMRIVLENMFGNAWKFTRGRENASVEFGMIDGGEPAYFVRDNGAGFDMRYVDKLFRPFQRLHTEEQFPGTGIGLATILRVIDRHGGRVWVEAVVGQGATFFFTLPKAKATALAA
jgi:light-regulated signal transduction histidine kinase (bacteriophytochrome)